MSLKEGGAPPGHVSHKTGKDVDLRPLRCDYRSGPTDIDKKNYSRELTQLLVNLLRTACSIKMILFDDTEVVGVTQDKRYPHRNHLHVRIK